MELLLRASDIDSVAFDTHAVQALEVVNLLGRHALAIHQAGACIRQGIYDLGGYKDKFQSQGQRLFQIRPDQARSQYGDVYATFEVSANYLRNRSDRGDQTAIDALGLLDCYAFMSFASFPEMVFEEAWRNSRELRLDGHQDIEDKIADLSLWHRSHLPKFMRQDSSEDLDMISLRQAQALLSSLSIVVLDRIMHTTRMHPVTHMWARDRLEKRRKDTKTWLGALAVLCCSIESPYTLEPWWAQLQPHIESIKVLTTVDRICSNDFHLHQSFFRLSWGLHKVRADKAVVEMLQACFIEADQSWTKFNYSEDIWYLYGKCLQNHGDLGEAISILKHVVMDRERLAEDDHRRLTSQYALAVAFREDRQLSESIELFEHIVKIEEKLAKDDPSRVASQHELALIYQENGQFSESIELLEHIIKIQEKLSEDDPSRLASQHVLAVTYQDNGQVSQAIKLLENIVKIQEELAEDHPSRLAAQYELGRAYQKNGQASEAIKLLEHTLEAGKEKLAEDNPSRLAGQHELAVAYQKNDRVSESIELLEHVVKITTAKLAKDHPSRLNSQYTLAKAYQENGQTNEAVHLLEHVVEIEKETLAEDDPSRLVSEHFLALAYQANGQINEAVHLLKHVV